MGATNTTANYGLSQFVSTDKPSWLQDYNGDMLKIDTGINAAKVAADSAALDAGAAQSDATAANTAINNTITPAITALQTTVGNQGGAINTINSLIGNGTPTTTDQTIIGAINEINAKVFTSLRATSTSGTFKAQLDSLYSAYNNLSDDEKRRAVIVNTSNNSVAHRTSDYTFAISVVSSSAFRMIQYKLGNGTSSSEEWFMATSGNTYSDDSSSALPDGSLSLYA